MYKKVLLAYDGSRDGRRALIEGADLATQCAAEVVLLAVIDISAEAAAAAGYATGGGAEGAETGAQLVESARSCGTNGHRTSLGAVGGTVRDRSGHRLPLPCFPRLPIPIPATKGHRHR